MNYKGFKARMEDFDGPLFPANIGKLNRIHRETNSAEGFVLEDASSRLEGFEAISFAGESAGIRWKGVYIQRGRQQAEIYFPLSYPSDEVSVTVYAKELSSPEVEKIIEELVVLFEDQGKKEEEEAGAGKKILAKEMAKNAAGKLMGLFKKK